MGILKNVRARRLTIKVRCSRKQALALASPESAHRDGKLWTILMKRSLHQNVRPLSLA